MSERCTACRGTILEYQKKVRCAGSCGEVYHVSCAQEEDYNISRGVAKDPLRLLRSRPGASLVSAELLDQTLQLFKQEIINESHGFALKSESSNTEVKTNEDINYIKKELSELRSENKNVKTQKSLLASKVKALEIMVDSDKKMFEEFKKVLRNLTKSWENNNKCVVDLKDELKELRNQNEILEGENDALVIEVRELQSKVNELERSLKNFIEKSNATTTKATVASPAAVVATTKPKASLVSTLATVPTLHLQTLQDIGIGASQRSVSSQGYGEYSRGNSSVTALSGIGTVYGGRLNQMGFYKVSQLQDQLRACGNNKSSFQGWLKSACGANSRWSENCYMDLMRM